jgi:hypothetical protein
VAHEFLQDLRWHFGGVAAAEALPERMHAESHPGLVGKGADGAGHSLAGLLLAALALEVEDFGAVAGQG